MTTDNEKSHAHLAELEKGLTGVARECRENIRFHSRGRLACFYNNNIDDKTYRELLTEHLGDTDTRRVFDMSDLMATVSDEDAESARGLIAAGTLDVNARDAGGNTALILSTLLENFGVTKMLWSKGADATLRNDEGYTALDIARRNRFDNIVELLSAAN